MKELTCSVEHVQRMRLKIGIKASSVYKHSIRHPFLSLHTVQIPYHAGRRCFRRHSCLITALLIAIFLVFFPRPETGVHLSLPAIAFSFGAMTSLFFFASVLD